MTRFQLITLAMIGSAALLIGAWGFQYFGYAPCKMCYWQRYPHMAAVVIGLAALALSNRFLPLLGALASFITGAIGVFHTGVEKKWWDGPATCTSSGTEGLTPQELLEKIMAAPLVRCDEVAWDLFGLSMATWNAALSFGLCALWIIAFRKS